MTIQAKDFRIGNIIYMIDGFNKDLREHTLDGYDIYELDSSETLDYVCEGIPLTEEWLLKFGFEKEKITKWNGNGFDYQPKHSWTERTPYSHKNNVEYRIEKWTYDNGLTFENQDSFVFHDDTLIKCDFVHQLQNLYFALTNQELKLKINE